MPQTNWRVILSGPIEGPEEPVEVILMTDKPLHREGLDLIINMLETYRDAGVFQPRPHIPTEAELDQHARRVVDSLKDETPEEAGQRVRNLVADLSKFTD